MRRAPAVEQMRADSPTNLSVAVDEVNRETRAGCSLNGLHTPGAHHWEPCARNAIANEYFCEDSTIVGMSVQHSIMCEDDAEKIQWVDETRQSAFVCEGACDADDNNTGDADQQVQVITPTQFLCNGSRQLPWVGEIECHWYQ